MGKASPCRNCRTDKHLCFKHYGEESYWVCCDKCGRHGPAKPSRRDAGEAWNKDNPL